LIQEFDCEIDTRQEYTIDHESKQIILDAKSCSGLVEPNNNRQMLGEYELVRPPFNHLDPLARSKEILDEAIILDQQGEVENALDLVCSHLDGLMFRDGFKRVGQILDCIDVSQLSVPLILCVLTTTAPRGHKVVARSAFFEKCRAELCRRQANCEELLKGLE
jgi:hypothetical protein